MPRSLPILIALLFVLLGAACTDPVKPAFAIGDPFYLVEGSIVVGEGVSSLRIQQSNFRQVSLQFEPVPAARVLSVEASGETVLWNLENADTGSFFPPVGFAPQPGQTWHFEIELEDGVSIVSTPETIPPPVPLAALEINFNQESIFSADLDRFIPRFELFVDYQDPPDIPNYYEWEVGLWEEIDICASCFRGIWRNGECISVTFPFIERYDYPCDSPECFQWERVKQVLVSDDAFSNGQLVTGFPVGGINFDRYGGLLAVVKAISLSPEAYDYSGVIATLINGQNALNTTIPVALDGNVRNVDPDGPLVLGYLRAVASSQVTAYIERTLETGSPLPFSRVVRLEDPLGRLRAPCDGPNRSTEPPPGWP